MDSLTHSSLSSSQLELNFGGVSIGNEEKARIIVGDRSVDFFFSTETFPMLVDGYVINMIRVYEGDAEKMLVQRLDGSNEVNVLNCGRVVDEASIETYKMTEFQKTISLLYLIAEVLPNGN